MGLIMAALAIGNDDNDDANDDAMDENTSSRSSSDLEGNGSETNGNISTESGLDNQNFGNKDAEEGREEPANNAAFIDNRLDPHGQVWINQGEVIVDPANNRRHTQYTHLNWHGMDIVRDQIIDSYRFLYYSFQSIFLRQELFH